MKTDPKYFAMSVVAGLNADVRYGDNTDTTCYTVERSNVAEAVRAAFLLRVLLTDYVADDLKQWATAWLTA